MKYHYYLIAVFAAALPFFASTQAEAETCRRYTKTIYIDGKREVGFGRACRMDEGIWKIVKVKGPHVVRDALSRHIYDDLHDDGYDVVSVHEYHHYYPVYHVPRFAYFDKHKRYKHHKRYHRGYGKGHYKHCRGHHY